MASEPSNMAPLAQTTGHKQLAERFILGTTEICYIINSFSHVNKQIGKYQISKKRINKTSE